MLVFRRPWHNITGRSKKAAIAWHVRLTSGDATDADYEAFSNWLSANPENFAAYTKVEEYSGRIDAVGDVGATAFDHFLEEERSDNVGWAPVTNRFSRAEKFVAAIAATLLVFVAVSYFIRFGPATEQMSIAAGASEFRKIDLSDGSVITLGPGAAVEATFSRRNRSVTSLSGIVFFDVESNHKRPFTIAFGSREIGIVGTQFEVSAFADLQSVAVAEGAVVVRNLNAAPDAASNNDQTNLFPGDRLTISDAAPGGSLSKAPAEEVGAWRDGYFEFDEAEMNEIVGRLNAFYGRPIFSFDDNTLAGAQFSGILKLSDPSGTASHLGELMPVVATATDGGFLLSGKPAGE